MQLNIWYVIIFHSILLPERRRECTIATIKDVAKLAGVSHGTVSNIINGKSNVKSETVKKVREAMETLGYQPDANAHGLRSNNKRQTVAFICPSIESEQYRALYSGICSYMNEAGMSVRLYISGGQADQEKWILSEINRERFAAAIIITCIPNEAQCFQPLLKQNIPLLFVGRKPEHLSGSYFISFDYKKIGAKSADLANGSNSVALILGKEEFSSEQEIYMGFSQAYQHELKHVAYLDENAESAYKITTLWIQGGEIPDTIFCSSDTFAKGVNAAVRFFCSWKKPRIFQLCPQGWINQINFTDQTLIQIDLFSLGRKCSERVARLLENTELDSELRNTVIDTDPYISQPQEERKVASADREKPLRVMLMEGAASYAARLLAVKYSQLMGIPLDIDILPYEAICRQQEKMEDNYDILQVNVSSLETHVEKGILFPMNSPETQRFLSENFSDTIIASYAKCNGTVYAIPYMFDAQILFYRKDLFEDNQLKRLFYETTHLHLHVPQTFPDMDRIGAFFTQAYNKESPVPYGVTAGGAPLYSIYEWMPRYFEKGGTLGAENIDPEIAAAALEEYANSFRYADPAAGGWQFSEQAAAFSSGKAAMMILYQAHLSDHRQHYSFEINKNIGYAPIFHSIRGGWSLGISADSCQKERAMQFITWLCSNKNAIPYNVLGGSLPCKSAFESADFLHSHPWLLTALHSARSSVPMVSHGPLKQWVFEKIAGDYIHQCIKGDLAPREAVQAIRQKLTPYYTQ